MNRFYFHLRGHRQPYLQQTSEEVLEACRSFRPTVLLATGLAPITAKHLRVIRAMGIKTISFLTDDPFNPVNSAKWFTSALPQYDCIFNPRRANFEDLHAVGCPDVRYLPFAYAPEIHFPECPADDAEAAILASDVFFAGGADKDRLGLMARIVRSGLNVALYGRAWERYQETRAASRGYADASTGRKAAAVAKISLCLVRRSNRDGHSMRSFELPAMRTCMVVEDTPEHREIFGSHGESVVYFQTDDEMMALLKMLKDDEVTRTRLADACFARIRGGLNTYQDRLVAMLDGIYGVQMRTRQ
jgi:spore maturation protein CgeB